MKQYPILFSTPMVQAILDGRKTQTRRVFKIAKIPITSDKEELIELADYELRDFGTINYLSTGGLSGPYKCPYGKIGDVLYVRETFSRHFMWKGASLEEWRKTIGDDNTCFFYKDGSVLGGCTSSQREKRWWPSIHMPKEAARIWLEITNVKVERLQNISEQDAISEGVEP